VNVKGWPGLIWHAPGKLWAGMLRAGSLATWMQWGAGVSATLGMLGYGWVIWKGPWPASAAGKQLELLGQGQMIFGIVVLVALAAIAGLRLAFSGGKDGFRAGVERDDDDSPPTVKVETVTTTQITEDAKT
jgi:hypothetical protein